MGANLVTLAEYKAYVGITTPTKDAAIELIITKASQLVKTYCRRSFLDYVSTNKVEVFTGGNFLLLSEFPVLSVTSVEYSSDYGKTYTVLTEFVDYVLNSQDGTIAPINADGQFYATLNGYKVTYKAGFTSLPEDLKLATLDLVTYYLKGDFSVKSSRDAGSNTVQIEYITKNTLPSHISRVLDLYMANVL